MKCLTKDRADLLAFYEFPADHWKHIRTTNPIESTFSNVRHRITKTKGLPQPPDGIGNDPPTDALGQDEMAKT